MTFVEEFEKLFGGRRDNWARGRPRENDSTKYEWLRVKEPLTLELLNRHLKGEVCVGIYPIVDGNVNWFAVDFDGPRDKKKQLLPNAYELALESAIKQLEALESAGLQCYIERSRSGNGCHVWGFLNEWMGASTVRQAIEPLLLYPAKQDGMDRLYPVQTKVEDLGEKLGNLLALPFYGKGVTEGKSVFIDPKTAKPIPPREWIKEVYKNQPAIILSLAEQSPKKESPNKTIALAAQDLSRDKLLTGALKVISPYGCKFMRYCWTNRTTLSEEEWYTMIGQCTYFENGRQLAHAMSCDYPKYSQLETNKKFDYAMQNPARGCQYINEHFPALACDTCPMKAPYWLAKKSIIELVGESGSLMEALGDFNDDIQLIKDLNSGKVVLGQSWGIPTMDSMTRLRPNELTVVGGLPSLGKTWLMVDGAYSMAQDGAAVMLFSAETSRQPLRLRLLARATGIELQRLRGETPFKLTKDEYKKLDDANAYLKELPIFTDFSTTDPEGVLRVVEHTLLTKRIPLNAQYTVIFDHLHYGLRKPEEDTDREHINRQAVEFKLLAKILEHPVTVFSQLRREFEGKEDPGMHWFADSSGIERNADVLIIMTGKRVIGSFAPRILHNVKQREGEAQKQLPFTLHQGWGYFEPPRTDELNPREDLTADFATKEQ